MPAPHRLEYWPPRHPTKDALGQYGQAMFGVSFGNPFKGIKRTHFLD
jgi:hypothetical protein